MSEPVQEPTNPTQEPGTPITEGTPAEDTPDIGGGNAADEGVATPPPAEGDES